MKKKDRYCECGFKLVTTKKNALTRILSMLGHIPITRDELFCRRCHKGYGVIDKIIEIYGEHRITKGMTETITYMAQLVPSFERASEAIKKLFKIDVSAKQIQIISEKVGKEVFEKDKKQAKEAYEKQFMVRVDKLIEKFDRVEEIYRQKVPDTPQIVYATFKDVQQRLQEARRQYGSFISPFQLTS